MATRILNSIRRHGGVVAPVLVLAACTSVNAEVVFHNGGVSSGGSGEIAVDFFTDSPDGALFTAVNFRENATLIGTYEYEVPAEPPVLLFELAVRNSTTVAWRSFHVDLFGADIFGFNNAIPGGPLARELDPVVLGGFGSEDVLLTAPDNPEAISISSSRIQRDGENASLWICFDDFVDPGETFQLVFWIDDVGLSESGFTIHQAPTPVTVADNTPPTVTVGDPQEIWPPNHRYRTFDLSDCDVTIQDVCGGSLDVNTAGTIVSIYSDEPEDVTGRGGRGDGRTVDDIVILGSASFSLRSERQARGNGRVYGIVFSVDDGNGNTTEAICFVGVPHDQSGDAAIDDGPAAGYTVMP